MMSSGTCIGRSNSRIEIRKRHNIHHSIPQKLQKGANTWSKTMILKLNLLRPKIARIDKVNG